MNLTQKPVNMIGIRLPRRMVKAIDSKAPVTERCKRFLRRFLKFCKNRTIITETK